MEFQFGKISVNLLLVCFLVMCTCSVLRTHCLHVDDFNQQFDNRINSVLSLLLESPELPIRRTEYEQLTEEEDNLDREKRFPRVVSIFSLVCFYYLSRQIICVRSTLCSCMCYGPP